jgi:hypothetical protein
VETSLVYIALRGDGSSNTVAATILEKAFVHTALIEDFDALAIWPVAC